LKDDAALEEVLANGLRVINGSFSRSSQLILGRGGKARPRTAARKGGNHREEILKEAVESWRELQGEEILKVGTGREGKEYFSKGRRRMGNSPKVARRGR